jgi:hypothetical protein
MNTEYSSLDVHGGRRLSWCPPHFTVVEVNRPSHKDDSDRIYEHLRGRFFLGSLYVMQDNQLTLRNVAAFEIAEEASYFMLINQTSD